MHYKPADDVHRAPSPRVANNNDAYGADSAALLQPQRECNDVAFLLLWLIVVGVTIFFAGSYGSEFIDATTVEDLAANSGVRVLLKYVVTSGFAAMGLSLVWIVLMIVAGKALIYLALALIVALNIVAAYVFTKLSYDAGTQFYYWPAVVFGLIALLTTLYACCVRKRIKFAAAHLRVAGSAIFRLPMTLGVAAVMVVVQVGWAITWVLGSLGLMFHQDYLTLAGDACTTEQCDIKSKTGAVLGVLCGMLLIYFWGTFVLKNVIAVTVAGTVAAWKQATTSPFITLGAWLRAVTLNLGSICFGSLIVAILETIRTLLNIVASLANHSGNCVAACLLSCVACLIGCLESWIEFFNRFAYTYVGVYGYSFVTASKHVCRLFRAKGWSAIVNDDLTGNVFFLGNVVIGAASAYIAVQMVHDADKQRLAMFEHPDAVVGLFAFLIGYGVNGLFMHVVASSVTTIFVLWAEDPQGWQLTRPEHYARLHKAWLAIYPEEYNNGYGKQVDDNRA